MENIEFNSLVQEANTYVIIKSRLPVLIDDVDVVEITL
jgi:hypothetical protein